MPPAQGLHDTSNQMPAIATIICGAITFRQSPLSCPPVRRNIRAQLKHWVSAAQCWFQSDPPDTDTHQSPSIRRQFLVSKEYNCKSTLYQVMYCVERCKFASHSYCCIDICCCIVFCFVLFCWVVCCFGDFGLIIFYLPWTPVSHLNPQYFLMKL